MLVIAVPTSLLLIGQISLSALVDTSLTGDVVLNANVGVTGRLARHLHPVSLRILLTVEFPAVLDVDAIALGQNGSLLDR